MNKNLVNYYNRFSPDSNYDAVLIRDGYAGQGAEINELQSILAHKIKSIAGILFKEGDILRDAQIICNSATGEVHANSGEIYIEGAARKVKENKFSIPTTGTVNIGVYLKKKIVSELEDPSLYNPAIGSEAEGEAGACREKIEIVWGWQGENTTDSQEGDFFIVHVADSGIIRIKDTPPQLDSTSRAIAKYDRDSAGGSYVIQGLNVYQEIDQNNSQIYTIQEGRARVNGDAFELACSRRIGYAAEPDLLLIEGEVHGSDGNTEQEIFTHRNPIAHIKEVRITIEKTATLSHGNFSGCQDALPDPAVIGILEIKQGNITYTQGTDYKFSGGKIDWSPNGIEPATGSSYSVTYRFRSIITPKNITETSFTIQNAASGSTIDVTYQAKMPRIDRLILTNAGTFDWIKGVPTDNPIPPQVPEDVLLLASVFQSWQNTRYTSCDTVKVVQMKDLMNYSNRIDWITEHVARQNLVQELNMREAGAKKGIFVDPFLNDDMRDQGIEQTAAIVNNELVLPVGSVEIGDLTGSTDIQLNYTPAVITEVNQPLRTGSMLVNPYSAFEPLPAEVKLTPSVDHWTEHQTAWTSAVTKIINLGSGNTFSTSTNTTTQVVSNTSKAIEYLRQIDVAFHITGFGPNEELETVFFDGQLVEIKD